MSAVDIAGIVTVVGSMVLVGSAWVVRRRRFRADGGKMALAWVAIFALLIIAGRWIDGHG